MHMRLLLSACLYVKRKELACVSTYRQSSLVCMAVEATGKHLHRNVPLFGKAIVAGNARRGFPKAITGLLWTLKGGRQITWISSIALGGPGHLFLAPAQEAWLEYVPI